MSWNFENCIYSAAYYNKTEVLTLGSAPETTSAPELTSTTAVQPDEAASVGTGRAGASVYPFPSFPLVLSPQHRAKSISTYAPQQQHFYNHASEDYRPRVVYKSQGN